MKFELRKRKSWAEEGGVSEVIGNILILMMTVVLFSGIIGFVQQMPVPQQSVKVDFSASVSFTGNYRHANLTLVHAGGEILDITKVKIIINRDGTNYAYNVADDSSFKGTIWNTGKSWTMRIDGTTAASNIMVTVLDLKKSEAIWQSQVTGGLKGNPPNILQRYVDSNPATSTPDPVKENDTFTFFVKVEDPDGDLDYSNVWIDASGVSISGSNGNHRIGVPANGWFTWTFGKVWNATAIDGSVIVIHASDTLGHEAISTFVLQITMLPSDTTTNLYPAYSQLGTSGLPLYLTYVSASLGYGFGFYNELFDSNGTATGTADTNSPSTTFSKESKVFVRFASLTMSNLFAQNSIGITDTRTGQSFTPNYPSGSSSTTSAPFYPYPTGGSASVYECVFDTTNLPPSSYTVSMLLMNQPASGGTPLSFQAYQMILVTQIGAPFMFTPSVQLFKSGWSTAWGTSKDAPYDVSSSDANTVYAAVYVQDTDATISPTVGQVRITDMSGGSELYGTPPAGSMLSKIRTLDGYHYNFTIGLRLNNGNQWLPGTNSYTLYITKLNDSNEGVYTLSQQIWIKGAAGRQDFFVGTDGISTGNANFITRYYPYYIQNNNFFTSQSLWYYENSPSACVDYTVTAMAVGDIDGDGGKDILMGQATSNTLMVFSNTPGNYGSWQPGSEIYRPDGTTYPITWIAFGDTNGDGLLDFAYANSNNQIVIYNNTYGTRGWIFNPSVGKWTGTVAKIDLKDMTNDGRADLVVLSGGKLWIYDLKFAYDPVLKAFPAKMLWTSSTGAGIKDFDVADMNLDGRLDIATVGTTFAFGSNNGGNVNLYNTGGGESTVEINTAATGYIPRLDYNCSSTGQVSYTHLADSVPITFTEPTSGSDNRVQATMRFNTTVSNTPDQTLRVRARISPGTPETFYVWVSPDNLVYNYVGQIANTSYTYYNFPLPASIMGTQMYVRFTDSLSSVDNVTDSIDVDYAVVVTSAPSFVEKAFSTDTTWLTVRSMNVDNVASTTDYLDVIAAKNGAGATMNVFHWTGTTYAGWGSPNVAPSGSSTFVVSCSGYVNDATNYPFSTLAPTMFDATDINGDGFTDILVSNLTSSGGNAITTIGFFMNLYSSGTPSWRYFTVISWTISPPQKGPTPYADVVVAATLYG